jgi:sporulation protein YlmC with PRC-barrel domain
LAAVDEGLPIAYPVLESGVPVYDADGTPVGTVDHVVAAPDEDIFHGLVIRTHAGSRFVAADDVASLHERGVDLRIRGNAVEALSEPHGGAPAWRDREPGVKPSHWQHLIDRLGGAGPHRRDWSEED